MEPLKVFVSSTRLDLFDFREAVKEALLRSERANDIRLLAMEQFGAKGADAVEVSQAYVREADILVGIYASRYGFQPTPDGPSVTELEFDAANDAGRRRLCYVAAADAVLPDPTEAGGLETGAQHERLANFKRRVDQLVRDTFATPDQLALKVVQDITDVLNGYPLGILPREVVERCKAYATRERSLVQADEPIRSDIVVQSPLHIAWRRFVTEKPWALRMLDDLDDLVRDTESLPAFEWFRTGARTITTDSGDLVLAAALTSLVGQRFFNTLDEVRRNLPPLKSGHTDDAERAHVRAIQRKARSFRDDLSDPAFDRMLLVLGSHGAGKTFFQRTRLDAVGERYEPLVVNLRRGASSASLGDRLLEAIRDATAFKWRSLLEFDRFLASYDDDDDDDRSGDEGASDYEYQSDDGPTDDASDERDENTHPDRLVVLIDDFQKGYSRDRPLVEDLDELRDFIRSPEHPRGFYWCLTAHDAAYPTLAPAAFQPLWHQFGFQDDSVNSVESGAPGNVGSWILLDAVNEHVKTGLALVRAIANEEGDAVAVFENLERSAEILLSAPLLALIAAQLRKSLPDVEIVDLHYVGFIKAFWEDRQRAFEGSDLTGEQLGRVVAFVARVLARERSTPTYGGLLNALVKEAADHPEQADLRDADKYAEALATLERANLMVVREEWSDEEGLFVRRSLPRIDIFWAWHLATQLTRPSALAAQGGVPGLLAWFQDRVGTELGDGAFAFALWLLDDRKRFDELRQMTTAALTQPTLPSHAAWLAGSRGTVAYQKLVIDTAFSDGARAQARAIVEAPGGQSLFACLHFVAHADAAAIGAADDRLLMCQPLYQTIATNDRADYFEFVARRALADVDTTDTLVNCLDALVGCEVIDLAETLAFAAYFKLRDLALDKEDDITRAIVDHLRRLTADDFARPKRRSERNAYLWQWLVHLHAREVAERWKLDAFDMFDRWGWFAPQRLHLPLAIGARIREEPKLALGWWYRTKARQEGRPGFVGLVEKLLQHKSSGQRETAYFLMRHTVPLDRADDLSGTSAAPRGPRLATVDADFAFAVKLADNDPSLRKVRQTYPVRVWKASDAR